MTRTEYIAQSKLSDHRLAVGFRVKMLFAFGQMRNFLFSLPLIADSARFDMLAGTFAKTPAICVGAGPSLEKNIGDLKAAQHKALIVAVDSIHDRLLAEGIIPHIVVTIDQQPIAVRKIQETPDASTSLVYPPGAHPGIGEKFERRFLGFVPDDFNICVARWLGLPMRSRMAVTSVSHFAFEAAFRMGCSPLVLVGQDMSVVGSESHAAGAIHRLKPEEIKRRYPMLVQGFGGAEVRTDPIFIIMALAYEEMRPLIKALCYNATEGGLMLKGYPERPLSALAADWRPLSRSPAERLEKQRMRDAGALETQAGMRRAADLAGEFNRLLKMCERMLEKSKGAGMEHALQGAIRKLPDLFPNALLLSPMLMWALSLEGQWLGVGGKKRPEFCRTFFREMVDIYGMVANDARDALAGERSAEVYLEWIKVRRNVISPLGKIWIEALSGKDV